MERTTRTNRHITLEQYFAICEWLRNKREVLTSEKPEYSDTCARAAKECGIELGVSLETMKSAMRLTGVTWTSSRSTLGAVGIHRTKEQLMALIDGLSLELKDSKERVYKLERELNKLATSLGQPAPILIKDVLPHR